MYYSVSRKWKFFCQCLCFTLVVITGNEVRAIESCATFQADPKAPISSWAFLDSKGSLNYGLLKSANKEQISDFSSAGYGGGGVALPSSTTIIGPVYPSGIDDTAVIQAAINKVANLPPSQNGIRGVVLLAAGNFILNSNTIALPSGVILRGSGSGRGANDTFSSFVPTTVASKTETLIKVAGNARTIFDISGNAKTRQTYPNNATKITDPLITSGSSTFHVADTSIFKVGDEVLLRRTVTANWIASMGMDPLSLVRDGLPQTWLTPGDIINADRIITGINTTMKTITLDAPISDTYDYTASPSLIKYTFTGRLTNAGIESIRVVVPKIINPISAPSYKLANISSAKDVWIKDVVAEELTNGLTIDPQSKRVTIDQVEMFRTAVIDKSAGSPAHFSSSGQQVLIMRSSSESGNNNVLPFVTQAVTPGPNVVLDMKVTTNEFIQPHQRWATGLLIDNALVGELNGNTKVGYGGIEFVSLGNQGSGHGWTVGWSVVWNSTAGHQIVQQPPHSMNWSIGTIGTNTIQAHFPNPNGIYESMGKHVSPRSLYLQQLCQRAGYSAVKAIGY
ncbi:MAG: hypothetical protein WCP66_03905 [Methylococcales bacterium]